VWIQVKRNGTLSMVWNGNVLYTNLFLCSSNGTYWTPINGQFAFGGRNGGDSEEVLLSNISITTTLAPAKPVAPIITSQPQSLTVNEGSPATFSVGFDGDAPFTFQWTLDAVPITDATNNILSLTQVSYDANGNKYACIVSNPSGSLTSQAATMTVIRDTTPPTVTNVVSDITFTNVTVSFDKPVSATALTASNYKVNGGVTVLSVTRVNQSTVMLATSAMAPASTYTLTINGVQDLAATPNTIAANTQVQFRTFVYLAGTILHKVYFNCSPDGYTLADLLADPRYPNNPDHVDLATTWEWPPNAAGTLAADPNKSMFYDSIEGYFIPPTTGDYVFYICGDDEFYLYLSTDEKPANMYEVAAEPGGWSDNRAWSSSSTTGAAGNAGYHSGTAENWVTSTYASTAWPNGNTITLTAGKSYYMIAFHHDHSWSGGDWVGVNYSGPGVAIPNDGDVSKLAGSVIAYDFNPTGASVSFSQQPQSVTTGQGTSASFSAAATGSSPYGTTVFYQWQLAPSGSTTWTNITGATAASYQTPSLALADNGDQFRVIATVAPVSVTSSVATVTVVPAAPVVSVGAIMDPTAGTVDVGVGFNKTVNEASAALPSNYSISPGTITSFTWCTNRFTTDSKNPAVMIRKQSALLTVTGLSGGGTLTVKNVADTFGNTLASTNVPFTVATNLSWGNVGANELGGWQAAVPVGPGDFDVYSDGFAEWGNYDETTFVYEKVTGDFDKKLRVEYQDGSSEWGRAGIIVRDVTDFGVDQALQAGSGATAPPYDGLAGRYQKCHVNPVGATLTGPGTAGNASWEGNRRLDTGGASTTGLTGVNSVPQYPNAWCRIQRKGQTFTIFRSDDGVNWVTLGETTWGQDDPTKTPMPATVYVGPEFSPENGNIPDAIDQGTFLAQFRDYGDYVSNPKLTIGFNAGKVTITWASGTLVSSPTVNGAYTPVAGAASPYVLSPPTGPAMFYRVME
jgi:hypothetical protein